MAEKVLVTGGAGFLGRALSQKLKALGFKVLILSRGRYPELIEQGFECRSVNLGSQPEKLKDACRGAAAVFHVAAKVEMWGKYKDFYETNVLGTKNLLEACKLNAVKSLIFTSSPSVIADGSDLLGINESYPYPKNYIAYYPMTKAIAEREVRKAGREGELRTISLRPHLIFGPGDTNLIPTVVAKANSGALKKIGDAQNLADFSYIEDCVEAHLCAMRALDENPDLSGEVYFISQGEPVKLWWWIEEVLRFKGIALPNTKVSKSLAYTAAGLSEVMARLGLIKTPSLTRFLVSEMSSSHYFDISKAKKELGYMPRFSIKQALERTFARLKNCPAEL